MRRRYEKIYSPAIGRDVELFAYGHFGRPMIAFPSGGGQILDFEDNGMVGALSPFIENGRMKLYCPESLDHESWLNQHADPGAKAVRHNAYQDFIVTNLVPAISEDCGAETIDIGLMGCSLGAYHAANFALKFPHLFSYALCMSGRYDIGEIAGQTDSLDLYFNSPLAYIHNVDGAALDFIRRSAHIALVCGQGAWEDVCLRDTHRLADLLAAKGISHERDIWGHDVEHHWYWWRKQVVHHLEEWLG